MSTPLAAEIVLADHPLHTAIPFFAPSLLIAGVLAVIVLRDRLRSGDDDSDPDDEDQP